MTKPAYPVAIVTWRDAWLEPDDTVAPSDIDHSPELLRTVGFLIRRDRKGVTLAMEYDEERKLRTVYFIPSGLLESVKIVRR